MAVTIENRARSKIRIISLKYEIKIISTSMFMTRVEILTYLNPSEGKYLVQ